ncbi:MAG: IS110 family transposase, partial [Clostridia bacterium]|nr:IS110 family transposase [Clostridia bacterium]
KAIIAVCRMILVAVWNILSKLEPYSPCVVTDTPAPFSKELTLSQALNILMLRGYIIKDDASVGGCT